VCPISPMRADGSAALPTYSVSNLELPINSDFDKSLLEGLTIICGGSV